MYKELFYECILYTKGPFVDARDIEQIPISERETCNRALFNSYTKGPFINARNVKKPTSPTRDVK